MTLKTVIVIQAISMKKNFESTGMSYSLFGNLDGIEQWMEDEEFYGSFLECWKINYKVIGKQQGKTWIDEALHVTETKQYSSIWFQLQENLLGSN